MDITDFFITNDMTGYRRLVIAYLLIADAETLRTGFELLQTVIDTAEMTEATRGDILLMSAGLVAYLIRYQEKQHNKEGPGEIDLADLTTFIESLDEEE